MYGQFVTLSTLRAVKPLLGTIPVWRFNLSSFGSRWNSLQERILGERSEKSHTVKWIKISQLLEIRDKKKIQFSLLMLLEHNWRTIERGIGLNWNHPIGKSDWPRSLSFFYTFYYGRKCHNEIFGKESAWAVAKWHFHCSERDECTSVQTLQKGQCSVYRQEMSNPESGEIYIKITYSGTSFILTQYKTLLCSNMWILLFFRKIWPNAWMIAKRKPFKISFQSFFFKLNGIKEKGNFRR